MRELSYQHITLSFLSNVTHNTHTHLPRVDMNRLYAITTVAGASAAAEIGAADSAPAVPLPATAVAAARAQTGVRAKMVLSMMYLEEGVWAFQFVAECDARGILSSLLCCLVCWLCVTVKCEMGERKREGES